MKTHLSISIATILALSAPGMAKAQIYLASDTVPATANVFSAGLTAPVDPSGGGAGTLPISIAVSPGQSGFQFSASGSITENDLYGYYHGPDGRPNNGEEVYAYGGVSGLILDQNTPLAGVFLTDAAPSGSAPPTLDFSSQGLGMDFLTLAPAIGQVFFIGDGQTSGGVTQTFFAPSGATRLFLGIPDTVNGLGYPGGYGDNAGSFSVSVVAVPEPSASAMLGLGSLALLGFSRMTERKGVSPAYFRSKKHPPTPAERQFRVR